MKATAWCWSAGLLLGLLGLTGCVDAALELPPGVNVAAGTDAASTAPPRADDAAARSEDAVARAADAVVAVPLDAASRDDATSSPGDAGEVACQRAADCYATEGLSFCALGLARWACVAGACAGSCDRACTGSCECATGFCREGRCVSGPKMGPCPACAFSTVAIADPCDDTLSCPRLCLGDDVGFPGGYTTAPCATHADCGDAAHCEPTPSGRFCVRNCASSGDCRADHACVFLSDRSIEASCWPRP